jgi:hypothetical protein
LGASISDNALKAATAAAFAEIVRQKPLAFDCSRHGDLTEVLVSDGFDLRAVVATVMSVAITYRGEE